MIPEAQANGVKELQTLPYSVALPARLHFVNVMQICSHKSSKYSYIQGNNQSVPQQQQEKQEKCHARFFFLPIFFFLLLLYQVAYHINLHFRIVCRALEDQNRDTPKVANKGEAERE